MIDLSTIDARLALAKKYAAKYDLDPCLICAVAEQESSWNPWSIRFEPGFLMRYIHPAVPDAPTTLEMTKAMSFGLMQVIGVTAMELGFHGKYLTELCDPDVGMEFGCKKLHQCFRAHPDPGGALLSYNGGGNERYPDMVLARLHHYSLPNLVDLA